jgi:hypothetical protein
MELSLSKINIAIIQLRTAIQLYNKKNYIAAITLAGAAEEILGCIAEKASGENSARDDKIWLDQIADYFNKPRISLGRVIKSRHKVKNQLKHNDAGEDLALRHDFKYEAEELILGAIRNLELVQGKMTQDRIIRRFWNWISM